MPRLQREELVGNPMVDAPRTVYVKSVFAWS
jgi:hypothetical protein